MAAQTARINTPMGARCTGPILLATPPERRKEHESERLRAIAEELDRIWKRLRERAERLAGHSRHETAQSHPDGS